MNPDQLYREHRDETLAIQAESSKFSCFVAQPFDNSHRYPSLRVLNEVLVPAARIATGRRTSGLREFDDPRRVGGTAGAIEITDEIVLDILRCHVFIADLTLGNPNVLLELGVALGLKPTRQIVLILDGDPVAFPFDIRGNNVLRYDQTERIELLATAYIDAALAFETEYQRHLINLRQRLSSDAIWFLRHLTANAAVNGDQAGLLFSSSSDPRLRYALAESELFRSRLVSMTHEVVDGGDRFSTSLTQLGRRLTDTTWPSNS